MHDYMPVRMLTQEQIEKIHRTSLRILWEIGVNIYSKKAVQILADHGCKVKGSRVLIPSDLIEKVRMFEGKDHVLYSRTGKCLQPGKGKTFVHNGGAVATITDPKTGKQRPAALKDGADLTKLMDALNNINAVTPIIYPQDVEQDASLLYAMQEVIKNTSKPLCGPGVSSLTEAKYIHEMFVLLAGDEKTLNEKPMYDLGFSPISPLTFPGEDTDAMIWAAEKGIAIGILPCPIAGMTAPLSILGSLTQQNAEILAALTLLRLINPRLSVLYSARLDQSDLRYGNTVGGGPEACIAGACAVQMADYYGLESNVYGAGTNAVLGDAQAGMEKAMNIFLPALAGSTWLSGAGVLADASTVSYEQLVIDDEIFNYIFHLFGHLEDDEETMNFSMIKAVMDRKADFLTHENTIINLRSPELWNRFNFSGNSRTYAGWQEKGEKSYIDSAREKLDGILKKHQVIPLDPFVEKELTRLVKNGEKELRNKRKPT